MNIKRKRNIIEVTHEERGTFPHIKALFGANDFKRHLEELNLSLVSNVIYHGFIIPLEPFIEVYIHDNTIFLVAV